MVKRQQGDLAAAEQRSGQQIANAAHARTLTMRDVVMQLKRPYGRKALVAEFGARGAAKWEKAIAACTHEDVSWEPVEIEYHEADVHVHQEGTCNHCVRLVQREFPATAPHTVIDD